MNRVKKAVLQMRDWAWHQSPSRARRVLMGRVANLVVSETCVLRRVSESSHEKTDELKLRDILHINWPVYSRMSSI